LTPQRATLFTAILGSGVVFLDGTVVNLALPAIREDLGTGLSAQQWIVEAYLLTLGALLLVGGSLGDLHGRRRIFSIGLAGFGATSVACGLAPTAETLIAARALQGVAGALLVPASLALITGAFEGHERAAAIGTWTAWTGVAFVIGPLGGGLLVDEASWRWIFLINAPLVAVTLWLARRVPESGGTGGRVDLGGAALCAFGLAGVVAGLVEQPVLGWGDPLVWGSLGAGSALLAAFAIWERRHPEPMLPPGIFASRNFAAGNAATLAVYAALGASTFLITIFLQQVAGYSAVQAGLALLPVTLVMLALASRFGALAERIGPRALMAGGPFVAGLGMLWISRLDADVDYVRDLLGGVLVFSLGLSMTVAPLTSTVLGALPAARGGLASGVNNAASRVAALLGVALVGLVVSAAYTARAPAGARDEPLSAGPGEAASVHAFHWALGATALLLFIGAAISAIWIVNAARPSESVPA